METLEDILARSRNELLDLSTRNRLLSIPVTSGSARVVHCSGESSTQVYRLVVSEGKAMGFLPGATARKGRSAPVAAADQEPEEWMPPPDEEVDPETGIPARQMDARLQTSLTPEALQRRLLGLFRDARTLIEEQGVNILYLALGQLSWSSAKDPDKAHRAPLILVPVELTRRSASERFLVRWNEEEIAENLSLRAKLKGDFGLDLPPFPEGEDLQVDSYLESVAKAVSGSEGWAVLPDAISLGFFSFAKFLMFRDLQPESWPDPTGLTQQPLVRCLLTEGFPAPAAPLPDETPLDEAIPVERLDHVVDADGSQTLAIESVRRGASLVIQGPPGTGKSQSITNIIATAVLEGKRVLFVAEKLSALEVVKRRLEKEGLGPICLELHSNKSNKRAVIREIEAAWKLGRPMEERLGEVVPKLDELRSELNAHAVRLHQRQEPSGTTLYEVLGQLARLEGRALGCEGVVLEGAESWTSGQIDVMRELAWDLADWIHRRGSPRSHPWCGVGREAVLRIDLGGIVAGVRQAEQALLQLGPASTVLAAALGEANPTTLAGMDRLLRLGEHIVDAPPMDRVSAAMPIWRNGLERIRDLLNEGQQFARVSTRLSSQVVVEALEMDFSAERSAIAAHGDSLFRFLNGDFRRAVAKVQGSLTSAMPAGFADRLALVDEIVAGQRSLRQIRAADVVGREAFGAAWRGPRTDWDAHARVVDWMTRGRELFPDWVLAEGVAPIPVTAGLTLALAGVRELIGRLRVALDRLLLELALDVPSAFGVSDLYAVPLTQLRTRMTAWVEQPDGLLEWCTYAGRSRLAREQGLSTLVPLLEEGHLGPDDVRDAFDRVFHTQMLRKVVGIHPAIGRFEGTVHGRKVDEFRGLDRERLKLARYRVLKRHFEGLPATGTSIGASGILRAEMERKRGHRTVRRLLREAGPVVQAIKPVFMMSPLSVAQFLEPGAVEFDLLVIDEASQIQPVDALGAIARCRQVVVVGDSRQLPPTRFFSTLTSEEDASASRGMQGTGAEIRDMESILGLCKARGMPEKMLRWHYRSRHHSLIAVSNREFYGDQLFIAPSCWPDDPELGLKFRPVPDGVFDRGGNGTNRVEAQAIARAVIQHARKTPGLSLGVAAFSVRQQDAILDELELLRREHPDLESFFSGDAIEPFFVKNLENVQGDERDVVLLSIGYGRDVDGVLTMNFGPLIQDGGERRLNVIISRARRRCEVFSSIRAADIDLARTKGRGVAALKAFLDYAEMGQRVVGAGGTDGPESLLEQAVGRAVESLGHHVQRRVGVAGFFIDLAVVDPSCPGRFLLGIELDGLGYQASRSARDRDRLRQSVLEGQGWVLHRVWGIDWHQDPDGQLERIRAALERARAARAGTVGPGDRGGGQEPGAGGIGREAPPADEGDGIGVRTVPYEEARFEVPRGSDPCALPVDDLARIVVRIVREEGLIHQEEVVNRVRDLWGLRLGARLQEATVTAVKAALDRRECLLEDGFLSCDASPVLLRNREDVVSANLRKAAFLPPAEVRLAILEVVAAGHGIRTAEVPVVVARVLGFRMASAQIRAVIGRQCEKLVLDGGLVDAGGVLRRPEER